MRSQASHYPVIWEHLHLVMWKRYPQEGLPLAGAAGLAKLSRNTGCTRRPMVAGSDVRRRNRAECSRQLALSISSNLPNRVLHAINSLEVKQRLARRGTFDDRIHRRRRAVSEKDWPGLSTKIQHVTRPVILLVPSGVLMLLN